MVLLIVLKFVFFFCCGEVFCCRELFFFENYFYLIKMIRIEVVSLINELLILID